LQNTADPKSVSGTVKKGSPRKTGTYTEPVRCRGFRCGKLFYTEYVNGYSWACPYCGTVH